MQRRGLALAGQSVGRMAAKRPSSDMAAFREHLAKARSVLVLTGAGVSAESGVPTFRGAGGLWRKFEATSLASPVAFARDPSLVWEFYHYRRELVLTKAPNAGHKAIAEAQARFLAEGKKFAVVTQNVDGLHSAAGATDLLELHGSLFKVRCTKCQEVTENRTSPICEALRGRGAPEKDAKSDPIPTDQLPKCSKCGGLLRPHIVWFGEQLEPKVLEAAHSAMESCDVCLVVGTSSVVYPAAMFAPSVAQRGVPVAEFNLEVTPRTEAFGFHFQGPSAETLPIALAPFSST